MFSLFDSFLGGLFHPGDPATMQVCPHCLCDENGPVLAEVAYSFHIKEPKLDEKDGKLACVRCHKQFKKKEELLGNFDLAYIVLLALPTQALIAATKKYLEFRTQLRAQLDSK